MSKFLPVPPELEHLIEKREGRQRRQPAALSDMEHGAAGSDPDLQVPVERRSGTDRRKVCDSSSSDDR